MSYGGLYIELKMHMDESHKDGQRYYYSWTVKQEGVDPSVETRYFGEASTEFEALSNARRAAHNDTLVRYYGAKRFEVKDNG